MKRAALVAFTFLWLVIHPAQVVFLLIVGRVAYLAARDLFAPLPPR